MRIAAEIVIVEDVVVHRPAVVVAEPVAPVITIASKLSLPDNGFDLTGVRPDANVPDGWFLPGVKNRSGIPSCTKSCVNTS